MATREDVIEFESFDDVAEGFPVYPAGLYLVRVTEPTVKETKAGAPYVEYVPLILAPATDEDGNTLRGKRLLPDRLYFVPNPVDRDGNLRSDAEVAKARANLVGRLKTVVTAITGEEPENTSPQELVEAINSKEYVAKVGIQRGDKKKGEDDTNVIRKHLPADTWEGDED